MASSASPGAVSGNSGPAPAPPSGGTGIVMTCTSPGAGGAAFDPSAPPPCPSPGRNRSAEAGCAAYLSRMAAMGSADPRLVSPVGSSPNRRAGLPVKSSIFPDGTLVPSADEGLLNPPASGGGRRPSHFLFIKPTPPRFDCSIDEAEAEAKRTATTQTVKCHQIRHQSRKNCGQMSSELAIRCQRVLLQCPCTSTAP